MKDVDLDQPVHQTPVAHLTGTEAFTPTDATRLDADVRGSGGTLLIDAAGGKAFADVEASWLPKILSGA